MPEIGQTISHYRIVEKIGGGGMGVACNLPPHEVGVSLGKLRRSTMT